MSLCKLCPVINRNAGGLMLTRRLAERLLDDLLVAAAETASDSCTTLISSQISKVLQMWGFDESGPTSEEASGCSSRIAFDTTRVHSSIGQALQVVLPHFDIALRRKWTLLLIKIFRGKALTLCEFRVGRSLPKY
jgi:hypothetical protein